MEKPLAATAPTARRKISSALASFKRLAFEDGQNAMGRAQLTEHRSGRHCVGGATTAPSAIDTAHGMVGMSVWATTAIAAVVNPTANTTKLVTGAQLSLRSLRDAS